MKRKISKVTKKRHKNSKKAFMIEEEILISSEDENSCLEVITTNITNISYEQFKIKNEEVDLSDQEFIISDDEGLNNEEVICNDDEGLNNEGVTGDDDEGLNYEGVTGNDDEGLNNEEVVCNNNEGSNGEDKVSNDNLTYQQTFLSSILSKSNDVEPTESINTNCFGWSQEMHKFIWKTYLIATNLKSTNMHLDYLHKEFSRKYPEMEATVETLGEKCRAIIGNNLLPLEVLNEIKEEVAIYLEKQKNEMYTQTYPVAVIHTPSNQIHQQENGGQKNATKRWTIWSKENTEGDDAIKPNKEIVRNDLEACAANLRNDVNVYIENNIRNDVNVISSDEQTISSDEIFGTTNNMSNITNHTKSNIANNITSNITNNITSNISNNITSDQPVYMMLWLAKDPSNSGNLTLTSIPMMAYPFNMSQPFVTLPTINDEVIDMTTEKTEESKEIGKCPKETSAEKLGDSFYDCDFEDMLDNLNQKPSVSNRVLDKPVREKSQCKYSQVQMRLLKKMNTASRKSAKYRSIQNW